MTKPFNYYFFFILMFLNVKMYLDLKITGFNPESIQVIKNGKPSEIYVDFDATPSDSDKNKKLKIINNNRILELPKSTNTNTNANSLCFTFVHETFQNSNYPYGKYKLYLGDVSENITSDDTIFLYTNKINLKTPNSRYFLTQAGSELQLELDLKNAIVNDQIHKITYIDDDQNQEQLVDEANYDTLQDDNKTLSIKVRPYNIVKTVTYKIYSEKNTNSPQYFYVYFQVFNISVEAVYARESSTSTYTSFLIQFNNKVDDSDKNFFRVEMSGSNTASISNVKLEKINNNIYNCSFTIGQNPSPGKINIIYKENIRPIYLITYKTDNNKCYLTTSQDFFEITFNKLEEMQYTHVIYFNSINSNAYTQLSSSDNGETKLLYSGQMPNNNATFYFISLISKLSTLSNPIDFPALNVTRYQDPGLDDNQLFTAYTHINKQQFVNFNMSNAGNVNEIILYNNTHTINLDLNECKFIKEESNYSCDLTNKIKDLDKGYFLEYKVKYKSICDNIELEIKNKIIKIEEGIFLTSIDKKKAFVDEVNRTSVTLTYSVNFNGNEDVKISFCEKNYVNCEEQFTGKPSNNRIITFTLKNISPKVYYIKTDVNGQIIQNDEIIFKVLNRLMLEYNHIYFVKNNGGEKNNNYLNLTNNSTEIMNEIIEERYKIKLDTTGNGNFIFYIYNVDVPRSGITFSYLDNDIKEYVQIQNKINVYNEINHLLDNNILQRNCFYYKFGFSISSNVDDLDLKIFVVGNNQEFDFVKNNKIFTLSKDDEGLLYRNLGKTYQLYISERIKDKVVFLNRTNIIFTNISVPEYVIYPNNSLYISGLSCNLCGSQFVINNTFKPVTIPLSNCNYNDNYKYLTIGGNFYNFYNREFSYFNYTIDGYQAFNNVDNQKALSTFISNQLDISQFTVEQSSYNDNDYKILIENNNKDFYMKLITSVTLFQIINNENKTIMYYKTSNDNQFELKESNYQIVFYIQKGNYDLYVNKITRSVESWEGNMGNTIHHFFDDVFYNNIFNFTPSVFASNKLTTETYKINITFINANLLNNYENDIKSKCKNSKSINNQVIECEINTPNLENKAQTIQLSFSYYTINLDLIYYYLEPQATCMTLDEENHNFNLIISVPDENYINEIYLDSQNYYYPKSTDKQNKLISYPIEIYDLKSLEVPFTITNNKDLSKQFILNDFGIKFLKKYEFKENGNVIILLPIANQLIKLTYEGSDSDFEKVKNIQKFKFGDFNSSRITSNTDKTINIIFNLDSNKNSQIDYNLLYIDECGESINTGIIVQIITFTFERHYFIIKNNHNTAQKLRIKGPKNSKINLYNNNQDIISYSEDEGCYVFLITNAGTYDFNYVNSDNPTIKNNLNEKVYVFEELSGLFDIKYNLTDCMFFNTDKSLSFSFKFNYPKNSESSFSMMFVNDDEKYSLNQIQNSDILEFVLSYQNKERIKVNKILLIYFSENNDIEQPLYKFEYQYSNIILNEKHSDVIYSDAGAIFFNMTCNISDLKAFNIYKENSTGTNGIINCINSVYENNIYKCNININDFDDIDRNRNYGYYILKYDSKSVVEKPFYFSHEIVSSSFSLVKEDEIYPSSDTVVFIYSLNKFYIPYIEHLFFTNCTTENNDIRNNLTFNPGTFIGKFNETNNKINITLHIENKRNYLFLSEICRKECDYCKHADCLQLGDKEDYKIAPNVPDIKFKFNRHYISLANSLFNDEKNSDLNITFEGEDLTYLTNVRYYIHNNSTNDFIFKQDININNSSEQLRINNLEFGIYLFQFKASITNKYFNVSEKVFVVNNDYELLNMNDLNYRCIYYNLNEKVLYTTLTIQENSIFKEYENKILNDLVIYYGQRSFHYIKENYGYKFYGSLDIECGKGEGFEFSIIENDNYPPYIFTELSHKINCTGLNFNRDLYKDNIVLKEQSCDLKNIYLGEENNAESMIKLNCDFEETEKKSYCDINQKAFTKSNIDVNIYFKYINNYLKSNHFMRIFNSIKDSNFSINYRDSVLSVLSSNFDMRNLSQVHIDKKLYPTEFIDKTSSIASFNYSINFNDTSKHNLTKLIRGNHTDDRSITIKHKDLNIEIKEIDCDEFLVPYNGQCTYCYLLSTFNLISSENKWYQNGRCVSFCNISEGYAIYDKKNYYCRLCDEKTKMGGEYYCSCLVGTVKNFEDNICYLPEDKEILKLRDTQLSVQCYKSSTLEHNYCHPNNTKDCNVEPQNGIFFPKCICKNNFVGKYCEFSEGGVNLTKNMDDILSDNNIINEKNITMISKIRGITYFLEIESSVYIKQFNDYYISTYVNSTMEIINKIKNKPEETVSTQIFDVMELAIYFLNYRIELNNKRNLQEDSGSNTDKESLKKILDNLHYLNFKANNETSNFQIQTDKLNLTTFIVYKKYDPDDDSFKTEMGNMNFFKILEYINISINETNENDKIFVTLINSTLFKDEEINENDFGVKAYFSTSQDINNNDIGTKTDFSFFISSSMIKFNMDLAEYYNTRNIKIYDKNDKAFVDPCFLSENFDYDLTQKYRKNNIFQKINYGNNACKYIKFDYKYKSLEFNCTNFTYINNTYINNNKDTLYYGMLEFNLNRESVDDADKVYNLPTKCTKYIDSVGENWAFWFFLIISVIEIMYCIGIGILTFGSLKNVSFKKGLIQDEFYKIIPYKKVDNNKKEESESDSVNTPNYIVREKGRNFNKNYYNYGIDNTFDISLENQTEKSFAHFLKNNFKELHPLASLCRVSLISPLILNSIFFVFNTLILFGFNALLYYESLIEKRIYNKKRDHFDYPMRKEFHKILFSILCQVGLCIIVKLILLVTEKRKNDFKYALTKCSIKDDRYIDNEIVIKVQEFQDDMFLRRIISSVIMVIIIAFFFYYSVAFCAVYIQTQRNWFFSGIWSLFFNWVVWAPLYIIIITALEFNKYKNKDYDNSMIYHMKRLFFF